MELGHLLFRAWLRDILASDELLVKCLDLDLYFTLMGMSRGL